MHFSPVAMAKEFLYTFERYLSCQRVDAPVGSEHPYAFTNSKGEPETLKNFSRQHKNAVNRIGLEHEKNLELLSMVIGMLMDFVCMRTGYPR